MHAVLLLTACGASPTRPVAAEEANEASEEVDQAAEPEREAAEAANPRDAPLGWVEGTPLDHEGAPMVTSLEPDVLELVRAIMDGTAAPTVDYASFRTILAGADAANGPGSPPAPDARPDLSLPPSCTPVFVGDAGGSRMAIQPGMTDQDPQVVAAIDAALALLHEGVEVEAWCAHSDEIEVDDPDPESEGMLVERVVRAASVWVINIRNQKLQAWARLDGHRFAVSPQR